MCWLGAVSVSVSERLHKAETAQAEREKGAFVRSVKFPVPAHAPSALWPWAMLRWPERRCPRPGWPLGAVCPGKGLLGFCLCCPGRCTSVHQPSEAGPTSSTAHQGCGHSVTWAFGCQVPGTPQHQDVDSQEK